MLEPRHLWDPVFTLFVASMSLILLGMSRIYALAFRQRLSDFSVAGLYTPVFYISSYALAKGVDPDLAFYT